MLNRDDDILQAAENWQKAGHGVALATVVETWGSAPRPAGSSLVINDDSRQSRRQLVTRGRLDHRYR